MIEFPRAAPALAPLLGEVGGPAAVLLSGQLKWTNPGVLSRIAPLPETLAEGADYADILMVQPAAIITPAFSQRALLVKRRAMMTLVATADDSSPSGSITFGIPTGATAAEYAARGFPLPGNLACGDVWGSLWAQTFPAPIAALRVTATPGQLQGIVTVNGTPTPYCTTSAPDVDVEITVTGFTPSGLPTTVRYVMSTTCNGQLDAFLFNALDTTGPGGHACNWGLSSQVLDENGADVGVPQISAPQRITVTMRLSGVVVPTTQLMDAAADDVQAPYTFSVVALSPAELLRALDGCAPGWRAAAATADVDTPPATPGAGYKGGTGDTSGGTVADRSGSSLRVVLDNALPDGSTLARTEAFGGNITLRLPPYPASGAGDWWNSAVHEMSHACGIIARKQAPHDVAYDIGDTYGPSLAAIAAERGPAQAWHLGAGLFACEGSDVADALRAANPFV